jgi:polar amino acid transport system substrate-binding protein
MSRLLNPASFFIRALVLVAWAWAAQPAMAAQEVRVGMGLSKPPYIMESGREGLEYEIAEQAFAAAGYKMLALQFPPVRGLAMQRAGQLDALLTVDEGIGGKDYFSEPYITYHNVATTLASRRIQLKGVEDLAIYSVAAFQNASVILGDRFKGVVAHHPNYQEHSQQITQNRLLYTGRVDVVVGDRLIFNYFRSRLDPQIDTTQAVTFHAIFPRNPRKAVFRDAALRDRFNAGLKTIQGNGVYDAILKKYQAYTQY